MIRTQKRAIGDLGEGIACRFLMKHKYRILDRNYSKKWGELDIIASKRGVLHFIEVKSTESTSLTNVYHETNSYRPEEHVHAWKLKRLWRTLESYLLEKKVSDETDWQIDVCIVYIDTINKKAKVEMLENVIA